MVKQGVSMKRFLLVVALINTACGGAATQPIQESTSGLASVSLTLPDKAKLPEGTASLLTHYLFRATPKAGPAASGSQGCVAIEKKAEYTQSATLEGKLNSSCSYEVVLVLGKPDATGAMEPMFPAAAGDSKNPQLESIVRYQGIKYVSPEDMKGKTKLSLTIDLEKHGQDSDPNLPDDLQIGEDLDLEVDVRFPKEDDGRGRPS